MATIAEIRQKYPQYSDLSDGQLARAMHAKYYSDLPFDQFSRSIGLEPTSNLGRLGQSAANLYRGASSLVNAPFDAIASLYNGAVLANNPEGYEVTINGQKQRRSGLIPSATQQQESALTALGVPEEVTDEEQLIGAATRGVGGALTGLGVGGALSGATNAVTSGVGKALASRPITQLVSGASAGGSADFARQQGAGPVGQFVAGIGGGMAGGLAASRLDAPEALPLMNRSTASSNASSQANASVGQGRSAASTTVSGGAQARGTGGGYTFGNAVDDDAFGLSVPMRRVAESGQQLGMKLTPGQASGSRSLLQLEAKLESQPMTSGPFNRIKEANQVALNRAWAKAIGVNSSTLDDATLGRALDRMEGQFAAVADDVPRAIDPRGYMGFIGKLQDDTRGLVKGVASEPLIEDLTRFASSGSATGKQLHSLTVKLGRAAYKNMTTPNGDRDLGIALYQAKDYVDDLLSQGLNETQRGSFSGARSNYRALMQLTRGNVINPSSGNVRGGALAASLQRGDRRGFTFGENQTDAYNAARFSQAFAPIVGDSGTATRSALPSPTDFVLSLPFNLATRAYTSSPAVNLATRATAAANAATQGVAPRAFVPPQQSFLAALLANAAQRDMNGGGVRR